MRIITLLENTSISHEYKSEHGLCFYIETHKNKILADIGPDGVFAENAKKMGVSIEDIDTVFISHGHNDHGGGLKYFLEKNKTANIYVSEECFENYYAKYEGKTEYIGLDRSLKDNNRIITVRGSLEINSEISIFSRITGRKCFSSANNILMREKDGVVENDCFSHEQCLVIKEKDKLVLIGGCAHNGILNILDKFKDIYGKAPDYVISGFHLYNPTSGISENDSLLREISDKLMGYDSKFYTCHCTGKYAFDVLKKGMGEKINYLATGSVLNI